MKNKKQHTPGPWKMAKQPNGDIRIFTGEPIWIAELHYEDNKTVDESIREEFEANAQLIASAPELLEALKDALSQVSEGIRNESIDLDVITDETLTKWEKAIAKAEKK